MNLCLYEQMACSHPYKMVSFIRRALVLRIVTHNQPYLPASFTLSSPSTLLAAINLPPSQHDHNKDTFKQEQK